jgi:hypothetical protein
MIAAVADVRRDFGNPDATPPAEHRGTHGTDVPSPAHLNENRRRGRRLNGRSASGPRSPVAADAGVPHHPGSSNSESRSRTAASSGSNCTVTMLQMRALSSRRIRAARNCRAHGCEPRQSPAASPEIGRQILDRLTDDEKRVLGGAPRRPAPVELREGEVRRKLADAGDLVEDVLKPDACARIGHQNTRMALFSISGRRRR